MRAAAELYAEIRHRDDAHDIAVLLTEKRHSAEFLRLVDFHLRDFHRLCHENLLIDQAFHFLQLQRRHRLEIGEVEAQALGHDQGASLIDLIADDALQRSLQEMRRRMVAR